MNADESWGKIDYRERTHSTQSMVSARPHLFFLKAYTQRLFAAVQKLTPS